MTGGTADRDPVVVGDADQPTSGRRLATRPVGGVHLRLRRRVTDGRVLHPDLGHPVVPPVRRQCRLDGGDLGRRPVELGDRVPDDREGARVRSQVGQLGGEPARGRGPVDHRWVRRRQPQAPANRSCRCTSKGQTNEVSRSRPWSLVGSTGSRSQPRGPDDLQLDRLDRPVHRPEQLDRRCDRSPGPAVADHVEPVQQLVQSGARAQLEQPHPIAARCRHEIEQPDQQRHRATDLVGLRCDRQRLVQLVGMIGDHPTHHRPGFRRRLGAAQAGVVGLQLRRPAGQHEPEDPGQQAQLDHRTGRGVSRSRAPPAESARRVSRSSAIPRSAYPYRWVCSPAWARNRWASVSPRSKPTITLRPSGHLSTLPIDAAGPRLRCAASRQQQRSVAELVPQVAARHGSVVRALGQGRPGDRFDQQQVRRLRVVPARDQAGHDLWRLGRRDHAVRPPLPSHQTGRRPPPTPGPG